MAGSGGEPRVARNQWSAELFGKSNICRVISGKIVTKLPNPGQQHEMRIPCNPEIQQVLYGMVGAICRNRSFPYQTPQYLGDLEIQEMRSMQRFSGRVYPMLDMLPCRRLKKPVHCGGSIQNNHRASRSSLTRRAVSSCAETGLR